MPIILPPVKIDSSALLAKYFLPYQANWIQAEEYLRAGGKQTFALAEKSVRIGWTFADAFKNVRKRLRFKRRDYLFATKDYPSALEYLKLCYSFADLLDFTRSILSHGEDYLQVPRLDPNGKPTGFTEEIKIGLIKFDNGSRIIAFSSNPRAMAVHAGDVGLDEFARHPNPRILWETAQGRVTWGFDLAIWSSHDGEDTLFHQFARDAALAHRTAAASPLPFRTGEESAERAPSSTNPSIHQSSIPSAPSGSPLPFRTGEESAERATSSTNPSVHQSTRLSPWNLYYRVTMADAIDLGLLDAINRVQGTRFTRDQFLADCRARAGSDEIFQQAYLCNPAGATSANIVDWSAIERCRYDYEIIRLHLENSQILQTFGPFRADYQHEREEQIADFIHQIFLKLFQTRAPYRLGFDVAASGQGDLAVIYIDESKSDELWLRALFTCRTEDWNFLYSTLRAFLRNFHLVQAAGDQTGLGRQICWDAANHFPGRFRPVNFSREKHDLGFALMNQLATAQKRFPRSQQDIAADFFALRKAYAGTRWVFSEARNPLNSASHCDIAWAGALATEAHNRDSCNGAYALVG